MSRSEQSAEAVVAAGMERGAERAEVHEGVPMSRVMRQMPERSGRDGVVCVVQPHAKRPATKPEARGTAPKAQGQGTPQLCG